MALDAIPNTDLAYDTAVFRQCASAYGQTSDNLRVLVQELTECLHTLTESGWTTPAGIAFLDMVDMNWARNIEKYADLLDTLQEILVDAADKYDELTSLYIERTKLG